MEPTETFLRRASTADHTEQQTDSQRRVASELSLKRSRPPAEIEGYEFQEYLGSGAYGEVWVALDQNTGRRVAVKFYTHRGGLDWRLLSREVEKLVLLSADRYIVQVLDVGWDATPPHYVMEYIENGSLDEHLKNHGPLPVAEAVDMFRGVATGLLHAHNKGVLHCDVKPANVLLDQDHKPRLADFGQSRLSSEQKPALGTMFYMAPEQADLEAMPDARWDVYALGVLLYLMLTGELPYRNEKTIAQINLASGLEDRLAAYRAATRDMPLPTLHRSVPGVDRALADVVDRCLAVNPNRRFPNVQTVLEALTARETARARRPLLTLGILGPTLLLAVMGFFGWRGYAQAMRESDHAVMEKVQEGNKFAVQFVASGVAHELERYYRSVENPARTSKFINLVEETASNEELAAMLTQLENLNMPDDTPAGQPKTEAERERLLELEELRNKFAAHPARQELQRYVEDLLHDERKPVVASWIVTDANGTHLASAFPTETKRSPIGRNFAWRSYFNGTEHDQLEGWHPDVVKAINATTDTKTIIITESNKKLGTTKDRTFTIATDAKISVSGQPAALADVAVGQRVKLTLGADEKTAVAIEADYKLPDTHLSGVFLSSATNTWKVAISTPIVKNRGGDDEKFLGVIALTVEMGRLLREFEGTDNRFAVLVENHDGPYKGIILQHPLFEEILESEDAGGKLPASFNNYRVRLGGNASDDVQLETHYVDPLGQDELGKKKYSRPWIMAQAPVKLRRGPIAADGQATPIDTGWVVLVQEDYESALDPIHALGKRLVREGMTALTAVAVTVAALWFFVVRSSAGSKINGRSANGGYSSTIRSEKPSQPSPK